MLHQEAKASHPKKLQALFLLGDDLPSLAPPMGFLIVSVGGGSRERCRLGGGAGPQRPVSLPWEKIAEPPIQAPEILGS